jgi:AraC family transcriptional regulator
MEPDIFARSRLAERALPSRRVLCSDDLGWGSMLAKTYHDPDVVEEFTTAPSTELTVVIAMSGTSVIESRKGSYWRSATYYPGSVGVTAPGNVSVLRWRSTSAQPLESLHLHLPVGEFWSADALHVDDPLIAAAGQAIRKAMSRGAPELYADSMAQMLVAHLMYTASLKPVEAGPSPMRRSALDRVTGYMLAHLHEDIRLNDLAALANVSKYHFLRMFARATGQTPHRYLTCMRMQRAAELLGDNDKTVLQIAVECGYQSPGQFAAAFRRQYGVSPTEYRNLG